MTDIASFPRILSTTTKGLDAGARSKSALTTRSVGWSKGSRWASIRMLLTITSTTRPAADLGYLLAKHPDRAQSFELPFGKARVFFPEASEDRCTFALLLEIDPIGLVRRKEGAAPSLFEYVNDRPYVASSFLSVAIATVLGSALNGRCKYDDELTERPLELEVSLSALPCRGGKDLLRSFFEPLGYAVEATNALLDARFPEWGESIYYELMLRGTQTVKELLRHLYVLVPVLDNDKHYWVGRDEVDKLVAKGEEWLADHPEREQIARRYLNHRRSLAQEALSRLVVEEDLDPDETEATQAAQENALEDRISLNDQRIGTVLSVLKEARARSVVDLGCGEGRLLRQLLESRSGSSFDFDRILGMDVSHHALEVCNDRLKLDRLPATQRARIELIQGSLTYRDRRLADFDAATVIEVIEHLDADRLGALERVVFEFAHPRLVVVTTPNSEYNALFPALPEGKLRHRDHRFEWTRIEFREWAERVAENHGYAVRYISVGPVDAALGAPTQMGVFSR